MYFLAPTCRVCVKNNAILINICYLDNDRKSFSDKLKICFPDIIFEHTNVKTYICQNCCSNLKKVYEFRELCSSSDYVLKQYISQLDNADSLKDKTEDKLNELLDKNYKDLSLVMKSVSDVPTNDSEVDMNIVKTEHADFESVDNEWLEPTCLVNIKNEEIELDDIDSGYQDRITSDNNEQNETQSTNSYPRPRNPHLNHVYGPQSSDLKDDVKPETKKRRNKHTCAVCNLSFKYFSRLKRHALIHTGIKPHACNICDKAFLKLYGLKRHKLTHSGIKPYTCEVCNKQFTSLRNLNSHISVVHDGIKPFSCSLCGEGFASQKKLMKHVAWCPPV